jgi:chemotaxis protein MotC
MLSIIATGAVSLSWLHAVPASLRPAFSLIGLGGGPVAGGHVSDSAADLQKEIDAADWKADEALPDLAGDSELVRLVHTMQNSLEQMGKGDLGASNRLKETMNAIRELLSRPFDGHWAGEEQDAIVVYLLSGGSPSAVENALKDTTLSSRRRAVLDASLAFVRGETKELVTKLEGLDAGAFPPAIQSRLLMIKAEIQVKLPYETRRDMLARSADIAAGTLVEEAAMRRLIGLSSANKADQDFLYWAHRYARRFAQSRYFGDFVSDFVNAVIYFEVHKASLPQPSLDDIVQSLPPDQRLAVITTLQLAAVRGGYRGLCLHMSVLALQDEGLDGAAKQRSKLYELACDVGAGAVSQADIEKLDLKALTNADLEVLSALKMLSAGILAPTIGPAENVEDPDRSSATAATIKAVNASVAQQLDASDKVLKGVTP